MIYGERVKMARELRGLTQTELAARVGVNSSAIARIETGSLEPSEGLLDSIALQTRFPSTFFRRQPPSEFPEGSLQYRALISVPARERAQARRWAQAAWDCLREMSMRLKLTPVRLQPLSEEPEAAARITRSALGLSPDTPIPHLIRAVEKAGVLAISLPVAISGLDAFSTWINGNPPRPVIVLLDGVPGDRLRFSTAHELGELIVNTPPRGSRHEMELRANRFAAELLMPEVAMRQEIVLPVTLVSIAELKLRWRVSMQALIRRARDLKIITPRQYTYLQEQMGTKGWRRVEPPNLDVPIERPRAMRKMAELVYGDPIDYKKLGGDLSMTAQMVREIIEGRADRMETAHTASESDEHPTTVLVLHKEFKQVTRDSHGGGPS